MKVKPFWFVLALLYLLLAIASLLAAKAYGDRAQYAPSMWMDQHGTLHVGGKPEGGNVAVFSLWEDLAKYFTRVTWISFIGFVLASAAAVVSGSLHEPSPTPVAVLPKP